MSQIFDDDMGHVWKIGIDGEPDWVMRRSYEGVGGMNPVDLINLSLKLDSDSGFTLTLCAVASDYAYFGLCDKDHMPEWFTDGFVV